MENNIIKIGATTNTPLILYRYCPTGGEPLRYVLLRSVKLYLGIENSMDES